MNSLAYIKEGWPGVWMSLPTFQHQATKNVRAILGRSWMLTTLHVGPNFIVGKTLIGKLSQCGNFPKHNAIAPDIRPACELSVTN